MATKKISQLTSELRTAVDQEWKDLENAIKEMKATVGEISVSKEK